MCILAVATAGAMFPRETLEDMFLANPDGAGWAYAKDGKIYFSKGYTSANKFIKAVLKLPEDAERMVHCRIATHGGVSKELTHPFPVSESYAKMEMLSGVLSSGYILAHNGILSNFTPDKSHSDTEELVRCLANLKCDIMGAEMRDIINALVHGSRVAILNTDGKINRYGTGWTQIDGIWYSNTYFRGRSAYRSAYSRAYNWDDWDDWDDWDYAPRYSSYGYAHNKSNTASTVKPAENLPAVATLKPLDAGEVIKNIKSKVAFVNATEGSYLVDEKSGKLYGQYKGASYKTDFEMCKWYNCAGCAYDCPIKDGGV